ncbi:MAG: NAD(P)/FAD-dependent oxidoreductase [Verrucomicrobia bacterium]|nr:NAD(P)/FAD-dependent oxidoreductase [Verrucomicrobiota bacterium]
MPANLDYDAVIVGAGPNGLAAAVRLAQAGFSTLLVEGNPSIGGACRTAPLTLPGFQHDLGSAVHPLCAASPFFKTLGLDRFGLNWVLPDVPLAHPLPTERAAVLLRSATETAADLDDSVYTRIFGPLIRKGDRLLTEILRPLVHLPQYPITLGHFSVFAGLPAAVLLRGLRRTRGQALIAGLAAHSFLALDSLGSAAFALVLGLLGHMTGWPIPRGGAQSIATALGRAFTQLGGRIQTGQWVKNLDELPRSRVILLDITPRQFLALAKDKLPCSYRSALERFPYGSGVFKVDYALSSPVPWSDEHCRRAGTIHIGAGAAEIARAERQAVNGRLPDAPFLLVSQPSIFDPSRAPAGQHVLWTYCHVPTGFNGDATDRVEAQIERFAPGFKDCVLARTSFNAEALTSQNPNLVDGTINGGANGLWQLLARPTLSLHPYRTPLPSVFLCSSSTPPGGGVHGMCGFHAAETAIRYMQKRR